MTDADVLQLNRLTYRYAAAVDATDLAAFVDVFHPDGRVRVYNPGEDEPFIEYVGQERLATMARELGEMFRCTAHRMTNHLLDVDGDTATGTVLCSAGHVPKDPNDHDVVVVVLRYVDRYDRRAGIWRITDRQIRQLWYERNTRVDSWY